MLLRLLTHIRNRNFQKLWVAQVISQFGDRIHQLALVGLIAQREPGSAMALAKIMAFTIIPVFVVQPFAGVLVDRFDRRSVLFVCDIARAVLVLLIPFVFMRWESIVPIYIIVFLVFSFSRFYVPAKLSIIPDLVGNETLLEANSLITTTGMIATALGAAFGAYLVEFYGPRNGFFIDAGTYLISAIFLSGMALPWKIKLVRNKLAHGIKVRGAAREIIALNKTIRQEIKEGFVYMMTHKDIRLVLSTIFILFGAAGAVYVVIIVFIQQSFGSVTKDLGILAIALVAGLFAGVLGYGRLGKSFPWQKTVFACLMLGGTILIGFAQAVHFRPNMIVAVALACVWGVVIGPIFVAVNTIVHLVSSEEMRGKVFSALEIVIHLSFLLTMFISSWLSQYIDPVWILSAVGGVCTIIGGLGWHMKPAAGLRDGEK